MAALDALEDWPVQAAAAAVIGSNGVLASHGNTERVFELASVTKLLAARAVQIAIEEGAVDLDTAAGPPGATVRHLLAHTSGLSMHSERVLAAPGVRRIYSNQGFTVLGETVQRETGIEFARYLAEAVCEPLGMVTTRLEGGAVAAGFGATSTVTDLAAFAGDLLRPVTVSAGLHAEATTVQFPGLDGVLRNSARTYGHFGQAGGFIWADPEIELALVVLTDRDFGEWALQPWPAISDAVISEYS